MTVVLALVYGYVPYLILALFAALDRIDQRLIEAARDLGAPPASAFVRVVLPLSRSGTIGAIVLIALPMVGDYYTPDLMSGSPKTSMIGNVINGDLQGGPNKPVGSALTLILAVFLLGMLLYYLRTLRADQRRAVGHDERRRRAPVDPAAARAAAGPAPVAADRPMGPAAAADDPHSAVRRLVAGAGAAGRALRVQRGALAHGRAGLLASAGSGATPT